MAISKYLLRRGMQYQHIPNFGANTFFEPADCGNVLVANSSMVGSLITVEPRWHSCNDAFGSNDAGRWRNLCFAVKGVYGLTPTLRLYLRSPGTTKALHNADAVSQANIAPVWSYDFLNPDWQAFDSITRNGSTYTAGGSVYYIDCAITTPCNRDVIYISVNEVYPVSSYFDWLNNFVFKNSMVHPTTTANADTFEIGRQSAATSSTSFSRTIPAQPLYGFYIASPTATPTSLFVLTSGQHPYEGQNKAAAEGFINWVLTSTSAKAISYRSKVITLVYPHINPTGEMAGLWRGTAYSTTTMTVNDTVSRDTNRNWDTTQTNAATNPDIDTVILHKAAMSADKAALFTAFSLSGKPVIHVDLHQNYGDSAGTPGHDYLLRSSSSGVPLAFTSKLQAYYPSTDITTSTAGAGTLRAWAPTGFGATASITCERHTYHTLASERQLGIDIGNTVADMITAGDI